MRLAGGDQTQLTLPASLFAVPRGLLGAAAAVGFASRGGRSAKWRRPARPPASELIPRPGDGDQVRPPQHLAARPSTARGGARQRCRLGAFEGVMPTRRSS